MEMKTEQKHEKNGPEHNFTQKAIPEYVLITNILF